jgi:hypothetical protein
MQCHYTILAALLKYYSVVLGQVRDAEYRHSLRIDTPMRQEGRSFFSNYGQGSCDRKSCSSQKGVLEALFYYNLPFFVKFVHGGYTFHSAPSPESYVVRRKSFLTVPRVKHYSLHKL